MGTWRTRTKKTCVSSTEMPVHAATQFGSDLLASSLRWVSLRANIYSNKCRRQSHESITFLPILAFPASGLSCTSSASAISAINGVNQKIHQMVSAVAMSPVPLCSASYPSFRGPAALTSRSFATKLAWLRFPSSRRTKATHPIKPLIPVILTQTKTSNIRNLRFHNSNKQARDNSNSSKRQTIKLIFDITSLCVRQMLKVSSNTINEFFCSILFVGFKCKEKLQNVW